jgi:hypothetical protein
LEPAQGSTSNVDWKTIVVPNIRRLFSTSNTNPHCPSRGTRGQALKTRGSGFPAGDSRGFLLKKLAATFGKEEFSRSKRISVEIHHLNGAY